jgi:hypothetical protein
MKKDELPKVEDQRDFHNLFLATLISIIISNGQWGLLAI